MNTTRFALLLCIPLAVSACANSEFVEHPILSLIGAESAQPSAGSPDQKHCARLAAQRAHDAEYSGEDEDTQNSVRSKTYSDCVAWDKKHAS
jgi:hypothetical protein